MSKTNELIEKLTGKARQKEAVEDAYSTVKLARAKDRLSTEDIAHHILDDFIELHGDRYYGDDKSIVSGVGFLAGRPVTLIGSQKGHTLDENIARNFGSSYPEGYRKAYRMMEQAEKFQRPVLTVVNTAGAYCSPEAESRGIGSAIAQNLLVMSQLTVPIVTLIVGEGGSGGALALAFSNKVWMMQHSMYSVLSPEGFASILYKDANLAKEAANKMKLTPNDLLDLGVIERIIIEENESDSIQKKALMAQLKADFILELSQYDHLSPEEIVAQRQARFNRF
ncbi:MAG TPA: acetyl-CoA carboxylase carboxyl transferase subunit alpha [Bavariicoccus seileri]|uniref:acetyl-CoA carboxytransferase n=1 Tax=Bavariicoccus seileri TaxID=549685 RepID=A0A3D4S451_9ENTE|nr:carboxyltransferase subunit alpha [Bavariicoccus seileri]HCS93599.1 acetyl-CoA carboxylase carboxyl transferase subunit alpha [Bavariicoccus seileri]